MATWKEGDRVRIVTREVTAQDREAQRYYAHMAGLTGTVQNVYAGDVIAVRVDLEVLAGAAKDVHKEATRRMRVKFMEDLPEAGRKLLTPEERNFEPHYMLLVQAADLEKA